MTPAPDYQSILMVIASAYQVTPEVADQWLKMHSSKPEPESISTISNLPAPVTREAAGKWLDFLTHHPGAKVELPAVSFMLGVIVALDAKTAGGDT